MLEEAVRVVERKECMDYLTDAEAAELERLEKAATPGPWESTPPIGHVTDTRGHVTAFAYSTPSMDGRSLNQRQADQAALIAAARNALPELISRLRAAEAEVASLNHALQAYGDGGTEGPSITGFIERIAELEAENAALRDDKDEARGVLASLADCMNIANRE